MNNKVLVNIYVPILEKEYNLYIPIVKRIGTVKNLIIEIINENTDGSYENDGCKYLYDKISGVKLDDNEYVKHSKIKNGTKLILY